MIEHLFRSPLVRRRIAASYLGIILEEFVVHLHGRGHALNCIHFYEQIIEHFFRWLGAERVRLNRIDEAVMERFIIEHLPHCKCPKPAPTNKGNCLAALGQLLGFLNQRQLIAKPRTARLTVVDRLVLDFDQHLLEVNGLSEATRFYRRRYAREFLQTRLAGRRLSLRSLVSEDLRVYIQHQAPRLIPSSLGVLTVSLRSFIRFLQFTGRVKADRVYAVSRTAPWPLSPLPQVLSTEQYLSFIRSFERSTAAGRRDYAIAMCLSRLGMRTHEVASLTLDDLDSAEGTVRLRDTKQRRDRLLPLPPAVARAISAYLHRGRPVSSSRAIFVRHRIPLGQALNVQHVRSAMRRAMSRAGLPSTRVHLLRYRFATRLCQQGVGLKAIADLLGHRSLNTTARYARVNIEELRQAALPWPEVWR